MKFSNQSTRFTCLLTLALLAGVWAVLPAVLHATEQNEAPQKPAVAQQMFASSDEAVKALQAAAQAYDLAALHRIFGPRFDEILTGDSVQDGSNARKFGATMAQGCKLVKKGKDNITLEIGADHWPVPFPLVKVDGQWHFDTAAGIEEMIDRHIGRDELNAIGLCHAYVVAQRQYARMNPTGGTGVKYAQHIKSTPGSKDGLYWEAAANEPVSPFGPVVAEAQAEGYDQNKSASPHPFHGYYFRILTRQGDAAPNGKKDYMNQGNLTGGFALVAYPQNWNHSGVMTFIVNQDGKVFQQNLGEKTSEVATAMQEYNPDNKWMLVKDEGAVNGKRSIRERVYDFLRKFEN